MTGVNRLTRFPSGSRNKSARFPFSKFDVFSCGSLDRAHLTEDKFQSLVLVSVLNIKCATVERFYKRLFHKNFGALPARIPHRQDPVHR